jgi:hypothetical protein
MYRLYFNVLIWAVSYLSNGRATIGYYDSLFGVCVGKLEIFNLENTTLQLFTTILESTWPTIL